jgi:hypothetical protein
VSSSITTELRPYELKAWRFALTCDHFTCAGDRRPTGDAPCVYTTKADIYKVTIATRTHARRHCVSAYLSCRLTTSWPQLHWCRCTDCNSNTAIKRLICSLWTTPRSSLLTHLCIHHVVMYKAIEWWWVDDSWWQSRALLKRRGAAMARGNERLADQEMTENPPLVHASTKQPASHLKKWDWAYGILLVMLVAIMAWYGITDKKTLYNVQHNQYILNSRRNQFSIVQLPILIGYFWSSVYSIRPIGALYKGSWKQRFPISYRHACKIGQLP